MYERQAVSAVCAGGEGPVDQDVSLLSDRSVGFALCNGCKGLNVINNSPVAKLRQDVHFWSQ